jgi:hypothetical protein
MKASYWITNGQLGSADNWAVSYSLHPNGQRALMKRIKDLANLTGRESWAELVFDLKKHQEDNRHTINRYYSRQPDN